MFTVRRRFTAVLAATFALVFSLLAIPAANADVPEFVTVRGLVLDHAGSPLEQVAVEFLDCEESQLAVCVLASRINTDVNGEFDLQMVVGKSLKITFDADDNLHSKQYWTGDGILAETLDDAVAVTFTAESNPDINVQLAKGAAIRGIALDQDSQPADGADISVKTESGAFTIKEGRAGEEGFELGGLPAGTYLIVFEHQGLTTEQTVDLTRGESRNLGNVYITDQLANVSPPVIEGDALVGATLSASAGTWNVANPSFTYRWFADGEEIMGAESETYVVSAGDLEKQITVEVTATALGYAAQSVLSVPTEQVIFPQIQIDQEPSITGDARVGKTLIGHAGTWVPGDVAVEYQWLVGGNEVEGATNATFELQPEHAGKNVTLQVTASKAGWESATEFSAPFAVEDLITLTNTVLPEVTGSLTVGSTLTATTGTWTASQDDWDPQGATFTYEWFLDETKVEGETTNQFVLPQSAVGKLVTVAVTVAKLGYKTSERAFFETSAPVDIPTLTSTSLPTVGGTAVVGATLKSSPGLWSESGVSYSYRWFANGVMISGATKSSYKLPATHAGKQITVGVAVTKPGFKNSVRVQSEPTARILHTSSLTVKSKNKKKRKVDFTVTVKSNKKNANGYVEIYRGSKRLKTVKLSKGKATFKLSGQPKGKHKYTVKYVGWGTAKAVQKTVSITTKK